MERTADAAENRQVKRQEHGHGSMTNSVYRIYGMDCASCAAGLESRIASLGGVDSARVNFNTGKMTVRHRVAPGAIELEIKRGGYRGELLLDPLSGGLRPFSGNGKKNASTLLSGVLLVAGFLAQVTGNSGAAVVLYAGAVLAGGIYIVRSGYYAVRSKNIDMNVLMTIAVTGAAAVGEWSEGATVVFLFALGNTLQDYTVEKTRGSIRSLIDLAPPEALVRRDGLEARLPVREIIPGDIVIVKPGNRIPVDGHVIAGVSAVDQAPITGESLPVDKVPGSDVFAGTINQDGNMEIRVTRLAGETTLARIINLVEEAQSQKAPTQQMVDRFARYYTPAVIILAAALAVVPTFFFGQPFRPWLMRALILLVISCPCALVISTPVSIVSAIGSAARRGVLIKGGAHLEEAGNLKIVAFDKTGTLTRGQPMVTDIIDVTGNGAVTVLEVAAGIEQNSLHPLAGAVLAKAHKEGVEVPVAGSFKSLTGSGASAEINGKVYFAGNPGLFKGLGVSTGPFKDALEALGRQGKTSVLIGDDRCIAGIIAFSDTVRKEAPGVVEALFKCGIQRIVMLTGDNRHAALSVAERVGIKELRSDLMPDEKLDFIYKLRQTGKVAMVGDGVNDAPALAAADTGIGMGGVGSDAALETARIVLMGDDLTRLPYAIKLSRNTLGIIRQNIVFSLAVKLVFITATLLGMATLWMAVAADMGASLLVTLNGMRLMLVRE